MIEKYAVIDLGTNTFNILIAASSDGQSFKEVLKDRRHVHLASDGIGTISEAAFGRGMDAMLFFADLLQTHEVKNVNAIGTAALRTASNGRDFIEKVKNQTGIGIKLIDGEQEAQLIYEGVTKAYPLGKNFDLIMDIGGGSVEFIIANEDGLAWKQSFPIGVAVLYKKFHRTEPITTTEVTSIHHFLAETLQPLFAALTKYDIGKLVGASGTFDVLENIFAKEKANPLHAAISVGDALDFYLSIYDKTLDERKNMPTVPEERATMIVVAMILVLFITKKTNIDTIISSSYAIKEGIIYRMINKKDDIRFL